MKRLISFSAALILIAITTGCQAPAPTPLAFSRSLLANTSREVAFDAAVEAMRERYTIASLDASQGEIRGEPVESNERNNRGRVGDLVGVPRRVRRVATARVTESEEGSEVWCKIVVEQQDTTAASLFRADMRQDDVPTQTPAERDGATTKEQNEVWRSTGRDKQGERDLLRSVEEFAQRRTRDSSPLPPTS